MGQRIRVIINPAAGQDKSVLGVLNSVFHPAEVEWDVAITLKAGDAQRFAQQALEDKVDVVAVYGGDGTVAEVASGLIGSDMPLAIFPGGTANVMSVELGISSDLAEACALACSDERAVVTVDMGQVGDRYFILRVGIGLEAEMVEGADRTLKDKVGALAYALSGLKAINDTPISQYRLTLDGETIESEGVCCLICNSSNLGQQGISLAENASVRDGKLDVFVLRQADLSSLLSAVREVIQGDDAKSHTLQHWQVREVKVEAEPFQEVQADGEVLGQTPLEARVIPGAVKIIVPHDASIVADRAKA